MTPTQQQINRAASLMGKRSAAVRRQKWGEKEFIRKMQEWGKLGGRPRKAAVEARPKSKVKGG